MSKIPASPTKDIIYIDIDDEITGIIDKVSVSDHKIVALVLPKRATMLQSVVNMKLLKRASDSAGKHLVLVTTEQGLLPLAGAVGMHVAATPQSKPVLPKKPDSIADDVDEEDYDEEAFSAQDNAAKPVGVLAGAAAIGAVAATEDETIQLDNAETPVAAGKKPKKAKSTKGKKDKKLKIPNFDTFRSRLLLGGGIILGLIMLFFIANVVLAKSTITIHTESDEIQSSIDVTFDKDADSINVDEGVVPSIIEQTQKTTTQTAAASGQKNNGEKAEGVIAVVNCGPSSATLPTGTGFSMQGKTFVSKSSVVIPPSDYSFGNKCKNNGNANVGVIAQSGGSDYNIGSGSYAIAGSPSYLTAQGTAMSGGTDNVTKILNQSDVEGAKQKLAAQVDAAVKDELSEKLKAKGLYVVGESFNAGSPEVTVSAKAGDQVDSVTVTQKTTYSLVGAKQSDIEELIKDSVTDEIDTDKQKVLKTGLDAAVFKLQNQQNNSAQVQMSLSTTVLAGPKLDDEQIKTQVAGKKLNETQELIKSYPGVTDVDVKFSPFWVSKNPKASKITITYEK